MVGEVVAGDMLVGVQLGGYVVLALAMIEMSKGVMMALDAVS